WSGPWLRSRSYRPRVKREGRHALFLLLPCPLRRRGIGVIGRCLGARAAFVESWWRGSGASFQIRVRETQRLALAIEELREVVAHLLTVKLGIGLVVPLLDP